MKRDFSLFRKWDFVLFIAILLLALLLLFGSKNAAAPDTVLVLYGGEVLDSLSLAEAPAEKTYRLAEGSVTVAFYADGSAILSSDCPRKSCVGAGKIPRRGSSAHCLPLRFSIVLAGEGGLDGVTG